MNLKAKGGSQFRLEQHSFVPIDWNGFSIENNAAIYFDFNEPVITNATLNTIDYGLGIRWCCQRSSYSIYPNPSNGLINLIGFEHCNSVEVLCLDINGREALNERTSNSSLDLSSLESGLYVVFIEGCDASVVEKVVLK